MAAINMDFKHGLPYDEAKVNFVQGMEEAQKKFGAYAKSVEWADDKTSAKVIGPGFQLTISVEPEVVRAVGDVPFFARLVMESPVRKFVEETFRRKPRIDP